MAEASFVKATDVNFLSSGNSGVLLYHCQGLLDKCSISGCSLCGVEVRGTIRHGDETKLTLSRCTIEGNALHGLLCKGFVSACDCQFKANGECGVLVRSDSQEDALAVLSNCSSDGNRGAGVCVKQEANCSILACTVSQNTGGGVVIADGAGASITSSQLHGNTPSDLRLSTGASAKMDTKSQEGGTESAFISVIQLGCRLLPI